MKKMKAAEQMHRGDFHKSRGISTFSLLSHFYRKCNVKIKRKIFLIIFKAVGEMFGTDVH